jgi:hypothetical protein
VLRGGSQNQCSCGVTASRRAATTPSNPSGTASAALVSRNGKLRVKSRRGWDMISLVPELAPLPDGLAVDGELVASRQRRAPKLPAALRPHAPRPQAHRVMLVIFDVLAVECRDVKRRQLPRPRRRRGEETLGTLPAGPSRLDNGEEPRLLAIPAGTCRGAGAAQAELFQPMYRPASRLWKGWLTSWSPDEIVPFVALWVPTQGVMGCDAGSLGCSPPGCC